MKSIKEYVINEQKSGNLVGELDDLVKAFCDLWEKTSDDDKEMLCKELIARSMSKCQDEERMKKAWQYCADEVIALWK